MNNEVLMTVVHRQINENVRYRCYGDEYRHKGVVQKIQEAIRQQVDHELLNFLTSHLYSRIVFAINSTEKEVNNMLHNL